MRTKYVYIYIRRYFQSLANGEVPPVKARYEMGVANEGGLSKGRLSALHNQFKGKKMASIESIRENWMAIGCDSSKLDNILKYACTCA